MKIKLMLLGIFLSVITVRGFANIIKPVVLNIKNDEKATAVLSNQEANRLFVLGDKINSIHTPKDTVSASHDEQGSVFITTTMQSPFTIFISTLLGRHFSLLLTPKSIPGITLKLNPLTPVNKSLHRDARLARRFEANTPYEAMLVRLLTSVMVGQVPAGYVPVNQQVLSSMNLFHLPDVNKPVMLYQTIERGFLGDRLAVVIIKVTNHGSHNITLSANNFYYRGVRAIAIDNKALTPTSSATVYEVVDNA